MFHKIDTVYALGEANGSVGRFQLSLAKEVE